MSIENLNENAFCLATSEMTPEEWMAKHEAAHKYFRGPRDRRIPAFLPLLTQAVCTLRFSLEQVRLAFEHHPQSYQRFREKIASKSMGLHGADPEGRLVRLLDNYLSRTDWREKDVLEMILQCIQPPRDHAAELERELEALRKLHDEDRPSYDRAISGLITEARGSLMGLMQAGWIMGEHPERYPTLTDGTMRLLARFLAISLGIPADKVELPETLPEDSAVLWDLLYRQAEICWENSGTSLPLKPYEKASLFLLESLPVDIRGHASFVRYLIEHDDACRRLLSVCYAPVSVQVQCLVEEQERYNRLPEYAAYEVLYTEEECRYFLRAFMLRPDVIAAIAERERSKDIYQVIAGLSSKALLPRILQEVQNIFGYVTPEAFQKLIEILEIEPSEVIRVIASYKQYSADPGGHIIIYICKGTACFLRGQPELSRRLASEIEAEEGQVGRNAVQFIEMDCFGVCHLAPVVKVRDVFLGNQTEEEIPRILEKLLKGQSYKNRMDFISRIRRLLAPGHESPPLQEICILEIVGGGDPSPKNTLQSGTDSDFRGWCLLIDASGSVYASRNGHRAPLGRLIAHSLAFLYPAPDGGEEVGCLILDENRQIQTLVHYVAPALTKELGCTLKPQAYVAGGSVWVERTEGPIRLGTYTANVIPVEGETGSPRLIVLTGPPNKTPPDRERGLVGGHILVEEEAFLSRQDRLVLGFAAGADPEDIESYIAHGGYESVHRVLGLRQEPAWKPEDIVKEVSEARLRGRGGAGFATGRKWEAVRRAGYSIRETDDNKDAMKLIVANGDEGDPGAFMDRTLIQERPHQVIEGMILAALAVGARYGVIYVRKEYEDAVRRLEHALFQARRKGYLGRNIFGVTDLHFDVDIRLGAGAFVAGEKRAIMRAIEGDPAEPTLNAASNTIRGLWGKPTLLNNVETFANVPLIIHRGGKWYARQGTERSGGGKIFSVAGIVKRTGLVEVRFGRTLNDIIRICGGIQEGKELAGVQIGGPSGAILSLRGVRSYLLHTPLDFDTFDHVGAMLGSGGLVFIGEDDDVVRLARHFTDWLSEESCGQCPSCLQGTVSLGRTLDIILQGEGLSDHIHSLWAKSDSIKAGSQCGLGTTSANPVTSALRFFPHVFLHHLLSNPRLNRLEVFKVLEALRFLTRDNIEKVSGRRRQVVGNSFTLKKHLLRNILIELERLDQYRPPCQRQAQRFLDLLHIPAHEVGTRDLSIECSHEDLERHRLYLQDRGNDQKLSPVM